MKKLLAVILAAALVLGFAACSKKEASGITLTEVKDVSVPSFKVKICGAK